MKGSCSSIFWAFYKMPSENLLCGASKHTTLVLSKTDRHIANSEMDLGAIIGRWYPQRRTLR